MDTLLGRDRRQQRMMTILATTSVAVLAAVAAGPAQAAPKNIVVRGHAAGTINFHEQSVGTTSAERSATFANQTSAAVTLTTAVVGPNAADYALTGNCAGPIAAGASCQAKITFKPSAPKERKADLRFSYTGAPGGTIVVHLRGKGIGTFVDVGVDLKARRVAKTTDLVYRMVVRNFGTEAAHGVKVENTLPTEVTWASGSCGEPVGQVVTCNLGSLAPGGRTVVEMTVHVTTQGPAFFTDTAKVSTTDTDTNARNDTDSVKTRVGKKHGAKVIVIVN